MAFPERAQLCRHNTRARNQRNWSTIVQSVERIEFMCVFWQTAGFGQFAQNRSKLHNKLPLQRNQAMLASAPGRHSARIATALAIVTAGSSFVAALPPPGPCRCRSAQCARWPDPDSKRDLPGALVIEIILPRAATPRSAAAHNPAQYPPTAQPACRARAAARFRAGRRLGRSAARLVR
jgi:hypothetical protein